MMIDSVGGAEWNVWVDVVVDCDDDVLCCWYMMKHCDDCYYYQKSH